MKKNTLQPVKDKSCLRQWFWILTVVAAGAAVGVFILFRHTPAAYQPKEPDNPSQVSPYLTHQLGPDFFNQVQLDKPFELNVEQAGLNDILSRFDWPQPLGDMSFSDPMVVFAEQSVYVMGTLEYGDISSVVTIVASPIMKPDGRMDLNIQSIRMGMMPVTTWVRGLAQKAFDDNQSSFEGEPQLEEIVRAVIHNEPFEPVFKISDRTVRITRFSVEPGFLKLMLETAKQ